MNNRTYTDLGSSEIYKRHRVMVEGGNAPRSKVMDQMVVDGYLVDGIITLAQHQAAEYILAQATQAGVFNRPVNLLGARGGEPVRDATITDSLMRFGRTMAIIRKRFGVYASYLVEEVVCHNWDVSRDGEKMRMLRDGLDLIVERRMAGGRNPMKHLKKK